MVFDIEVAERGDWHVVIVTGDLDVATSPKLRETVISLVAEGRRSLVVDLCGVDFCDSTGLGTLVGALKRARSHDGRLVVAADQPHIRRIFDLVGLVDVLGVADSAAQAAAAADRRDGQG